MASVICTKQRKQRVRLSLDKKVEILNKLRSGLKQSSLAREYGLNESTIRTIKRKEDAIRKSVAMYNHPASAKCSIYTRDSTIEAMEKNLLVWIQNNVENNISVNSSDITKEALRQFQTLKEKSKTPSKVKFMASKGWLHKFKRRYNLNNCNSEQFNSIAINGNDDELSSDEWPIETKIVPKSESFIPDLELCVDESMLFENKDIFKTDPIVDTTESETTDSNYNKADEMTAEVIDKGLRLGIKLQTHFLKHDRNTKRALKFQRDLQKAMSQYEHIFNKIYEDH